MIEAMGCGCPVVSTDCPSGPQEILQGGRYGTLVQVGDHQAMAEAIEANLDSPPLRTQLLERAACFSVDKSVDHYEALVRNAG
jgi:glycosyltransferase involved in cell wall biosynthesis